MSLEAYAIFDAVVKEKSFYHAAGRLNLSPSAISHSISNLENRFHVKLFNRSKTGVTLTSAGADLLPYIERVLKTEEMLQHQVRLIMGEEMGTVRIGLFNSVCISWFPHIMRTYREKHPNIEVIVMEGGYKDILDWIAAKAVDLAFISSTVYKGKNFTSLHHDNMICIAPKDFVPINKTYVTAEDIMANHVIFQTGHNNAEIEQYFARHNLPLESKFIISDDQSFISLVECGFGLCLLQELNMYGSNFNINIFPLRPRIYRDIGLVLADPAYSTAPVIHMHGHIVQTVRALTSQSSALDSIDENL